MYKFIEIGTGSEGNCNFLSLKRLNIILDAGIKPNKVLAKLFKNNIKLSMVDYVLITHRHGDHNKYEKHWKSLGVEVLYLETFKKSKKIGSYDFVSFKVKHSVDNYGLIISDSDKINLLWMTDFEQIPTFIKELPPIELALIECNRCDSYFDSLPVERQNELWHQTKHHVAIETIVEAMKDLSINKFVAIHLSQRTNTTEVCREYLTNQETNWKEITINPRG